VLGNVVAYEILLMLDPEAAEERQGEIVVRVRDLVERGGGTWRSHDSWGRRRLAFEIDHKTDAYYHLVVFEAAAETLDEITRVLKIDDSVMRHLAVRHIEGSRTSAPREEYHERPQRTADDGRSREYAGSSALHEEES
jgi:small subunit ribosomal protein S6